MAMRERLSARGVLKVSQTQLSDPGKTIIDFYERTETPATKNLDQALCPPQAKKIKSGRGRTPMVAGQEMLVRKMRRKAERRKLALLADSQETNDVYEVSANI